MTYVYDSNYVYDRQFTSHGRAVRSRASLRGRLLPTVATGTRVPFVSGFALSLAPLAPRECIMATSRRLRRGAAAARSAAGAAVVPRVPLSAGPGLSTHELPAAASTADGGVRGRDFILWPFLRNVEMPNNVRHMAHAACFRGAFPEVSPATEPFACFPPMSTSPDSFLIAPRKMAPRASSPMSVGKPRLRT